jgi:uncharacterized protein YcgL (UPF0745 family)
MKMSRLYLLAVQSSAAAAQAIEPVTVHCLAKPPRSTRSMLGFPIFIANLAFRKRMVLENAECAKLAKIRANQGFPNKGFFSQAAPRLSMHPVVRHQASSQIPETHRDTVDPKDQAEQQPGFLSRLQTGKCPFRRRSGKAAHRAANQQESHQDPYEVLYKV